MPANDFRPFPAPIALRLCTILIGITLIAAACTSDDIDESQRFLIGRPNIWEQCGDQCATTFTVNDTAMNELYSFDLDGDYKVVTVDFPGRVALVPWSDSDPTHFLNLATGELLENTFLPRASSGDQRLRTLDERTGLTPEAAATMPWRAVQDDEGFLLFDLRSFDERSLPVPARTRPMFSPSGARLAYLDATGNVVAVEVASNEVVARHRLTSDNFDELAWSTDGERIAVSRLVDDQLQVNVITVVDGAVSEVAIPSDSLTYRQLAGWFDDQRLLLVGSLEAQLVDVDTGELGPAVGSHWDDQSFATQQWHLSSCCYETDSL